MRIWRFIFFIREGSMRISIFFVMAASTVLAQSSSGGSWSLQGSAGPGPQVVAVMTQAVDLPTTWVNTHEGDSVLTSPNQTINFPSAWTGGGPYTASSCSGLNTAIADAETYRKNHLTTGAILINIPLATLYSVGAANCLTLPQTAGDTSTNFIALVTTGTLAAGQTVCAHGIQDNVAGATDIGTRNPACNSPNDAAQMWTVQAGGAGSGIITGPCDANGVGPHHYLIIGAEVREDVGDVGGVFALIRLGDQNRSETTVGCLPSHIYVDRVWLHGDRTDAFGGSNNIQNNIMMDCNVCGFTNSQISQAIYPGVESHGVWAAQSQTVKIVHNWIEGPAIDIFFGAVQINILNGMQAGNDVEIRRNRLSYPFAWVGTATWTGSVNNGQATIRKNSTEFKSANRMLEDGNILENVGDNQQWRPFGLNPKAQNTDNVSNPQYFVNVANVTWTNNIHRNVCGIGSVLSTRSSPSPNGEGVSMPMQNLLISNNLWYNADKPSFCSVADGNGLGFAFNSSDTQFTGCTALRDSAGLTTTLTCTATGGGMAQTDTNVGDPTVVSNCSDSTFNVGVSSIGPPALPGTNPNGLTIVYSNPGTANAATSGCTFDNFQGYPKNLTLAHNTFIFSGGSQGIYVNLQHGASAGWTFMQNNTVTDNIILGQGVGGQGTSDAVPPNSQSRNWDLTTGIWHHNLYVGRTCSHYAEILTLGGTISYTPVTDSCPSTPNCTTNDPTAGSCVGMNGVMSTGSMNVNLADWHGYRLCHSGDASCLHPSPYATGQASPASDGIDRGANFTNIDNAQTQTQYPATGSFPD
jgi:hypothetical protein